ncbi:peroxidase P7 [Trifolium repens]|nr:peroxidase P7 [Trifolium repens]
MASSFTVTFSILLVSLLVCSNNNAQLSPNFYASTCPNLQSIVRAEMIKAIKNEARIGASILRLFFHDCFVNGCDGSILLDDTATFTGEKNAAPNKNSARGFEVIDAIKNSVEASCSATVSCADILALATRDGIALLGGPSWIVPLGRRDARTASQSAANTQLPSPSSDLATLIKMFQNKGLTASDLTVLSGAHTIGQAECQFFRTRIYNETNIEKTSLAEAEFQTGYSSPTQDAIRKDLNLSLAELCVCFRVCVVAFVVSESGAAGFIIWRNGL